MYNKRTKSLKNACPILQGAKGILLKSVGVVNASVDSVFEVVLSLDSRSRYE